jgi:hypothetical protein
MQFTGWREPISMSGLARSLAAYCADGLVFCGVGLSRETTPWAQMQAWFKKYKVLG